MTTKRRRVYIETPYRADTPAGVMRNLKFLWACMRDSIDRGEAPFASHGLYTFCLDDNDPVQRETGMECGFVWAEVGAEATCVYQNLGRSGGMQKGIERADDVGRPVEYRTLPNDWESGLASVTTPDVVRALGWSVAAHNDYRQDGKFYTFWLFTKGHLAVKGEGASDGEALDRVIMAIGALEDVSPV